MANEITVLIADDSALMRQEIKRILEQDSQIRVVACARNGQDAVRLVREHEPNVVTMDINMPVMDGITALQMIMMESPRPVVMLSSLTQEGAVTTFECLELGAVDFIGKPSGSISRDIDKQSAAIITKVKAAAHSKPATRLRRPNLATRQPKPAFARKPVSTSFQAATQVVVIGISTGGPKTLMEMVPKLPGDLDAAVVIIQHMPEAFTGPFASRLNSVSQIEIKEAATGDLLLPGHGYLARGGKHLVFSRSSNGRGTTLRCVGHPKDKLHIPSADVTMDSAVEHFGSNLIGVLMTGMGSDGADGMLHIRNAGGQTIAQDESTCVVYGMPAQAVARGGVDYQLPSYDIARKIVKLLPCRV